MQIPPALRHRRYALWWSGTLISVTGSQMQLWTLFWHLRTLSDQPAVVSGVGATRFLPVLVFALIGGLAADRLNRRRILFFTQGALILVAVSLGLLTWLGVIQIWHIYLLTAIQAAAFAFDSPARQSLVPNLIDDRADLTNAFSMNSIAHNTGAILGPALSGFVILLGIQYVYWINAVSFLAVIAALVAMGPAPQDMRIQQDESKTAAIRAGIRFLGQQPVILSGMLLDFWATFFSSAKTLLPFVARDILHVGALEYGWLSAAESVGSVTVGLTLSQRSSPRRQGPLLLWAVAVFGAATIVFGLSTTFWLTFVAIMVSGAADTLSAILRQTIRQLQTPDHMRGRVSSLNQIFMMGGPQLGEVEAGLAAQAFGVAGSIVLGGVGALVAAGLIALRWPQLRRYHHEEAARDPA